MDRGGVVQDFVHALEQLSNPVMIFKVKCIFTLPLHSSPSVQTSKCWVKADTVQLTPPATGSGSTHDDDDVGVVSAAFTGDGLPPLCLLDVLLQPFSPFPFRVCALSHGQSSLIILKPLQNYHLWPSL